MMRRKEREIQDRAVIVEMLRQTEYGVLSLCDGEQPYAVPLHYACDDAVEKLYFHCAQEGRKLDILKKNNRAHFLLARSLGLELYDGKQSCQSSADYESLMLEGQVHEIEDATGKEEALDRLMRKYMPEGEFVFSEGMLKATCVLCFSIERVSGKVKKRKDKA